jgi:hypothetical protein
MLLVAFGGQHPMGGNFVTGDLIASGSGAGSNGDGVGVIETDATNCMNLPAEAMEMETPIRLNRVALRAGSGGIGQFRGGPGTIREYEALVDNVTITHRGTSFLRRARRVRRRRRRPCALGHHSRRWHRGNHTIEDRYAFDARRPGHRANRGWRGLWRPGGADQCGC